MKSYTFKLWPELIYALATFALTVGTAFIATSDPPSSWRVWIIATVGAGARAAVASILPRIVAFLASKK